MPKSEDGTAVQLCAATLANCDAQTARRSAKLTHVPDLPSCGEFPGTLRVTGSIRSFLAILMRLAFEAPVAESLFGLWRGEFSITCIKVIFVGFQ